MEPGERRVNDTHLFSTRPRGRGRWRLASSSSSSMARACAWFGSMTRSRRSPARAARRRIGGRRRRRTRGDARRCRGSRRRPRAGRPALRAGGSCRQTPRGRSTAPAWWDGGSRACRYRGGGWCRAGCRATDDDRVAVEDLDHAVPGVERAPLVAEPPPRDRRGRQREHDEHRLRPQRAHPDRTTPRPACHAAAIPRGLRRRRQRRHTGRVTGLIQPRQRVGLAHDVMVQERDGGFHDDDLRGRLAAVERVRWSSPWSVTKNFGDSRRARTRAGSRCTAPARPRRRVPGTAACRWHRTGRLRVPCP